MKYIASWSGGKDSTASIILAHENNEPLDLIIFSEVMFDKNISGELPEHIDFVKNKCIPLFQSWGYEIKILYSDKNYMDCFHHVTKRGKNVGKKKGFVMSGRCDVQRDCKLRPINQFWKSFNDEYIQYIGIAIDEPERLARLTDNKISLLAKYGYTERMALSLCIKYDLLSPIYDFSPRGGCWFCPNARIAVLKYLRENHRDLWEKLLELEETPNLIGNMWNTLSKTSIHDMEKRFKCEERQTTIFERYLADIFG